MSFKLKPRSDGGPYQTIDGKYIIGYDMSVETENTSEISVLEKISLEGIKIEYCNRSFEVNINNTRYESRLVMDPGLKLVDIFVDDERRSILRYQESQNGATNLDLNPVPENLLKNEIISTIKNAVENELNSLEKRLVQKQNRL
jgi:hypothetical protein